MFSEGDEQWSLATANLECRFSLVVFLNLKIEKRQAFLVIGDDVRTRVTEIFSKLIVDRGVFGF